MTFWNWWTSTIMTYLGLGVAAYFGAYEFILNNDFTYISFMIIGIFLLTNLYVGLMSWNVKNGAKYPSEQYGPAWFTSDALLTLGMVGTLIGFLAVLTTAFAEIDTSSQESMKEAISQLATGMGTALLTTLTGLVTSLVLKAQLVNVENGNAQISQ